MTSSYEKSHRSVDRNASSLPTESATEALADFITGLEYDDLPPSVVTAAKRLVLDSVGCAIGGATLTPGRITIDVFESMGGLAESTVWATGTKLPCPHTAYVNAYLANAQDFDDTYTGAGHPGATAVQPALAVGEKIHASGRQVLTAIVAGYEVSVRIGLAIAPSPERYRLGWGGFGFHVFGAAAVASKLLGLDSHQTAAALGLAGISAPVPTTLAPDYRAGGRVFDWSKCDSGWRAFAGVLAALKAREGFLGHTSILDGEYGFWRMIGSDRCDFQRMTAGLGREFLTLGIEFKPYPTCRWTHSSIDALDAILASHPLDPNDVEQIVVRSFSSLAKYCNIAAPSDIVEAQFALPYLLALRLHGKSLTSSLSEEILTNKKIIATAHKVSIENDSEAEDAYVTANDNPATVILSARSGETYAQAVRHGRGGKYQALTSAELEVKFRGVSGSVVGSQCTNWISKNINRLEEVEDVTTLSQCYLA